VKWEGAIAVVICALVVTPAMSLRIINFVLLLLLLLLLFCEMRIPRSLRKSIPSVLVAPTFSAAAGTKKCDKYLFVNIIFCAYVWLGKTSRIQLQRRTTLWFQELEYRHRHHTHHQLQQQTRVLAVKRRPRPPRPRVVAGGAPSSPAARHFSCHLCAYSTDRKNNLKRHVTSMHRDVILSVKT